MSSPPTNSRYVHHASLETLDRVARSRWRRTRAPRPPPFVLIFAPFRSPAAPNDRVLSPLRVICDRGCVTHARNVAEPASATHLSSTRALDTVVAVAAAPGANRATWSWLPSIYARPPTERSTERASDATDCLADPGHGCQMAIAKFLDHMCLALQV